MESEAVGNGHRLAQADLIRLHNGNLLVGLCGTKIPPSIREGGYLDLNKKYRGLFPHLGFNLAPEIPVSTRLKIKVRSADIEMLPSHLRNVEEEREESQGDEASVRKTTGCTTTLSHVTLEGVTFTVTSRSRIHLNVPGRFMAQFIGWKRMALEEVSREEERVLWRRGRVEGEYLEVPPVPQACLMSWSIW
jgi:hypothetical protein